MHAGRYRSAYAECPCFRRVQQSLQSKSGVLLGIVAVGAERHTARLFQAA